MRVTTMTLTHASSARAYTQHSYYMPRKLQLTVFGDLGEKKALQMRPRYQIITAVILVSVTVAIILNVVLPKPKVVDVQALYQGAEAYEHIATLTNFGPRVAGGSIEKAAADYIADQMEIHGLVVEIQEFPVTYFEDLGSTLEVIGGAVLSPNTLHFSPSSEFTTEIVECGLGYPVDFTLDVAGNIALIRRGELLLWQKTQNAAAAGALATVIYNSEPGNFLATLTFTTDIPAVSVSLEDGTLLLDRLTVAPVTVHLTVETVTTESTSQNVIGTLEGTDPKQGIVYLGAHYDSVSVGSGANDDASGVGAMLEAARVLSTKVSRTKATLKFIAFGAEETGLDGSEYYVTEHADEVGNKGLGMINLDMIAVGDTLLIGNIGSAESSLVDYTRDKGATMGISWQPFTAEARSDHAPFETAGVPSVFLHQSPDPWVHTEEDTLDKIDVATLEMNGELATATMYDWARTRPRIMEVFEFISKVILITGSGALAPGPLFFATISHGARSGARSGLVFSISHTLVEFTLVMLLTGGLLVIAHEPIIRLTVGAVGGVALLAFGLIQIHDALGSKLDDAKLEPLATRSLLLLGLSFTGLNPFFVVWWLTIGANLILISLEFASLVGVLFMYACHVWMDYLWLTSTAHFAKMGTNVFGFKWYKIVVVTFGIILVYFGLTFIISSFI